MLLELTPTMTTSVSPPCAQPHAEEGHDQWDGTFAREERDHPDYRPEKEDKRLRPMDLGDVMVDNAWKDIIRGAFDYAADVGRSPPQSKQFHKSKRRTQVPALADVGLSPSRARAIACRAALAQAFQEHQARGRALSSFLSCDGQKMASRLMRAARVWIVERTGPRYYVDNPA